jgi:hypothetical protein
MWTDEGYGPTWDSDDEYDNFIRKMNPPRCTRMLFLHPQNSTLTGSLPNNQCLVFLILVYLVICSIVIDNDSCKDATIVRVYFLLRCFLLTEITVKWCPDLVAII